MNGDDSSPTTSATAAAVPAPAKPIATNTMLTGQVADLVEGDRFIARVAVAGTTTYDTQAGGTTTAPELAIAKVTVQ